jgi:phage terminase large subunit
MGVQADFPDKLQILWRPKRYKVLYGGRGSAKSWSIARALVIRAATEPLRVLCCREQQNSIAESVHKLLSDQIEALGYAGAFEIQRDKIIGPNGSTFSFEGIRNNAKKVKSYEGIDLCWIEEADNLSEESMSILVPTIRKDNSEIWISFNPDLESAYVYRNYVLNPQPDSAVVFMTWRDNPWFPEALRREMENLKERDFDAYLNVWEGQCRVLLAGAVYAAELRATAAAKRVTSVPYDPTCPVDTFWDLGWADSTAIWFRQRVGFEWHYIDYYSANQKALNHFLTMLQERPYVYGTHWLPHDAVAKEKGTGQSIADRMRRSHPVRVVRRLPVADGIDAARTIFPMCWFDERACAEGLKALRAYRYEVQDSTVGALSRSPIHDWASHGADAFRYSAVAIKQPKSERMEAHMDRLTAAFRPKASALEVDPFTGMPVLVALAGAGTSTSWMER